MRFYLRFFTFTLEDLTDMKKKNVFFYFDTFIILKI